MTQTLLYELASISNEAFGYWPPILVPFIVIAVLVVWQIRNMSFNLTIFVATLSIYPAITPAVTEIIGFNYFTMLNYDLQQDPALKTSAVMLISLFTAFIIFGGLLPNRIRYSEPRERHFLGDFPLGAILVTLFLMATFFLESGTVLTQGYGAIKNEGQAPFSSLVGQFFNACVATFLCYLGSQSRQRLALAFHIAMIVLLLLLARRTVALSLIILLIYSLGSTKLSFKKILFICLTGMLFVFVGEARSVGILNYFQGVRLERAFDSFVSLPGGASNIFGGSMGVIHMLGQDVLSFPETIPILLWPLEIYESSIYGSLGYDYNGGMHFANLLYWNFGLAGVIFSGIFLGWVTTRVHIILSRVTKDLGGTYPAMIGFAFILQLPNLVWYHPIGMIKLMLAVTFGFLILTIIKRATKPLPSGGSSIGKSCAHR